MERRNGIKDPTKFIIFGTSLIILGVIIILGYLWVLLYPHPDFDIVTVTIAVLTFGGFWLISGIFLVLKREALL